jgi:phosphatidate cytidylyltransferase
MSNLSKRLLTAAVVIPVLVLLFYLGGFWYFALIEVAILIGMGEYYRMIEAKGLLPQRWVGIIAAFGLGLISFFGTGVYTALFLTVAVLAILSFQLTRLDLQSAITGSAATMMGVIYVGWLLSHAILLRNWPMVGGGPDIGFFFIILVIATTFLADAGAFFTGRYLGKNKLWPRISPKKTWEGAVGGVVVGTLGTVASKLVFDAWIFETGMSLIHCLILGAILCVVSIFGDLSESMLKRDAGIKDSGTIIPGHGGILDRLDSLLFTIPTTYYYIKIFVY